MCGFVGSFGAQSINIDIIDKMTSSLHHRGPDSKAYWVDKSSDFSFGHTRLAIQDVSTNGAQPMHSYSGRYVIVFNGEIYNHFELRKQIQNTNWNGRSDTETALAVIENYGILKALNKFNGMFAFALWDKKEKVLTLARDRIGEKPLYYGWQKDTFLFGSELKSMKCHPSFQNKINKDAVSAFYRFSYIPSPLTIYRDIFKLEPGSYAEISIKEKNLNSAKYWSIPMILGSKKNNHKLNEIESIRKLDEILNSSIKLQQISDVPLGAFLSGGVDSSIIASIMQSNNTNKIKTFTISLENKEFDESQNAVKVSEALGTEHNQIPIGPKDVLNLLPNISKIYDEPFADSSQIPTYFVSKFASSQVKVCLSGDAGDELFGGYNRYIWSLKYSKFSNELKFILRTLFRTLPLESFINFYNLTSRILPSTYRLALPSEKFQKIKNIINNKNFEGIYTNLCSTNLEAESLLFEDTKYNHIKSRWKNNSKLTDEITSMMLTDIETYLTDDILCKVDRAAMSNSLETRVPFLDHRLVEFAVNLDLDLKIRNGENKYILRRVLDNYLPRKITNQVKQGFGIPIASWLRGPLREWASDLLSNDSLKNNDFINSKKVSYLWQEHQSGKRDWHTEIWNILMFQSWLNDDDNY